MKRVRLSFVVVLAAAASATAAAPLAAPGPLLEAGVLYRLHKLCGSDANEADRAVLGDVLLASSAVPTLSGRLDSDAKLVASLRSPSKEWREAVQTGINIYGDAVGDIQAKFQVEGRGSVCVTDLGPRIAAFAAKARATGVAVNAKHVAEVMVSNSCPALGACR
jgi:hypothetical protein